MRDYTTPTDALRSICADLLSNGDEVGTRQGDRAKELLNQSFRILLPLKRVILQPERKVNIAAQIAETMWVLAGRNDVGWLKAYLPQAPSFSDDGYTWRGAYGPRLRAWGVHLRETSIADIRALAGGFDQLIHVIKLLQHDPMSRRATISLYDPVFDADGEKDIPCNNWLTFMNRLGRLDLVVGIRSNDVMWGWSGINQFEWSVLLEIVAYYVGVEPGTITYMVGSQHLYDRHWGKARSIVESDWHQLPTLRDPRFRPLGGVSFDELLIDWFDVENLIRNYPAAPERWADRIEDFPEDMMASWLWVIAYFWTGDPVNLKNIAGTSLAAAAEMLKVTPLPPKMMHPHHQCSTEPVLDFNDSFYKHVTDLHRRKHEAYGDSWKKRGELLSIVPNIARKVDRLGKSDDDETALDTIIDLLVYLTKYLQWLQGEDDGPKGVEDYLAVSTKVITPVPLSLVPAAYTRLQDSFEALADAVQADPNADHRTVAFKRNVRIMADYALRVAKMLYVEYIGDTYQGADVD